MRIYFDTCCLCRLSDLSGEPRVVAECSAVRRLLERVGSGSEEWVSSDTLEAEIRAIPLEARRAATWTLLDGAASRVPTTPTTIARATAINGMGFRPGDALHIACAEASGATVLLTVDDRMLRRALGMQPLLHVRLVNPVDYLQEVTDDD